MGSDIYRIGRREVCSGEEDGVGYRVRRGSGYNVTKLNRRGVISKGDGELDNELFLDLVLRLLLVILGNVVLVVWDDK